MNNRQNIRTLVRGGYDIQQLRIQMGNRIVANFKSKLGIEPGKKEDDELDQKGKELLGDLRKEFRRLTDGVVKLKTVEFPEGSLISSFTELSLVASYLKIEQDEKEQFSAIGTILEDQPIWTEYLRDVKGVGPAMAGVLISEIDIHKARYPSSLWAYFGLDTAPDGRGRGRYEEHLRDVEYLDKNGEKKTKKGITFNAWGKTKILGVLVPSFLRSSSPYADVYRNYKNRLQNRPDCKELTKLHIHKRAVRYAAKIFLLDLYKNWRELEGLEVSVPYAEGKLGIQHSQGGKGTPNILASQDRESAQEKECAIIHDEPKRNDRAMITEEIQLS